MKSPAHPAPKFTGYQKFVIALLAFLQFTIVLDFMILSPLGAILMPVLQITPAQFGLVVSAYAFSAGASGFLAAGFADRYDRKKILLFFYVGFVLGTLLCGIATTYEFLLFARMITGIFGGVIGSVVFAISTDLFPVQMRGRVMGAIQTSFAASQIMGLPLGLYLSNHWGWHAPFLMIVGVSAVIGVVIVIYLRPINAHLALKADRTPLRHLIETVSHRRYLQAFAMTALLSTGGYMIMPFSSAFSVNNLGISLQRLPFVYMITGLFNILLGPISGKLSDRFGAFKVFTGGTILGGIMILIYSNMGPSSIELVIFVNIILFAGLMSRMIASSALISAVPEPDQRGAFMAVSASLQQVSGGVASALAGLIVVQTAAGPIEHFDTLGYVVLGAMILTWLLMVQVKRSMSLPRLDAKGRT